MFKLFNQFERLAKRSPALAGLIGAMLLTCSPLPARAATNIVNTLDALALETAIAKGGIISIQVDGTITETNTIYIESPIVIDATGYTFTLSGGGVAQLFNVSSGMSLTVSNMTITSGSATGAVGVAGAQGANGSSTGQAGGIGGIGSDGQGGAVLVNGGAMAAFVNCSFLNNTVTGGAGGSGGGGGSGDVQGGNGGNGGNGGGGYGGAIYNLGTLLLTNCTVSGNTAAGGNGGLGGTNGTGTFASYAGGGGAGGVSGGGGLYNLGTATIVNCTFSGNSGQGGNSETAGTSNTAHGLAGAPGANSFGGGICNLSTATFLNCTLYGNQVTGGAGANGGFGDPTGGNGGNGGNAWGGNLYNDIAGSVVALTNCTISDGAAFGGTNGFSGAGTYAGANGTAGLSQGNNIANNGGTFSLINSILNHGLNGANSFGTIIDDGHNLSSDATPAFTKATSRGSLDPKLITPPRASNGGPTATIGLQSTSPAINAGDDSASPPFDQRGVTRPQGTHSCIGAFEFGVTTFTIRGQVTIGTNKVSGVTVTAAAGSASPVAAVSAADGSYVIPNLISGTYTVVPQPPSLFFPTNAVVTVSPSAVNVNFTAKTAGTAALAPATNNAVQFSFSGIPNQTYQIQVSTNLSSSTNWLTITNLSSGASGTFNITDTITNSPVRFYRAVTP